MRIFSPAEVPTTGNRSGARRSQCWGSPCQSRSRSPTRQDSGSAPVSDNSAEAGPLWMRAVSEVPWAADADMAVLLQDGAPELLALGDQETRQHHFVDLGRAVHQPRLPGVAV